MLQPGGFTSRLLRSLLKTSLLLMKNVRQPLAKNVLMPLGSTSAALAADAGMHKNLGSGTTTLIKSNDEIEAL